MSDSVRPHRRQPTRLPRPLDSLGKNTGVGCHFLLQCMKVESESEVTHSCQTLRDPVDCSLPGSSFHGVSKHKSWSGLPFPSPVQKILVSYKKLYANKQGNLEETDKFLETYNLSKLNHEDLISEWTNY